MAAKNVKQWISALLTGKDKFAYLRDFALLKDFTNHELYLFSQIINVRNYHEGELIYQEEFPLAVIYLILNGSIQITEHFQVQDTSIIRTEHQFIGIIDLYYERKRKGEAKSITDSVLLAISHLDFQTFIKSNPRTGIKLLNNICRALSHDIVKEQHQLVD